MPTRSFETLQRRLVEVGFDRSFIKATMLPSWWDKSCEDDDDLLAEVEFTVARFLHSSLEAVQDPALPLKAPQYSGACLRLTASVAPSSVAAAMHAAAEVAAAVVRNLRESVPAYRPLPSAEGLRNEILRSHSVPDLARVVERLWAYGVPVVHLSLVPKPKFQGMALLVDGRPVVVLAYNADQPAKLLFHAAHEAGHIALGHVRENEPVFDATEDGEAREPREIQADEYALVLCSGLPTGIRVQPRVRTAHALAAAASVVGTQRKVDPGHLVLSWPRRKSDHGVATAALVNLRLQTGAKALLGKHLAERVAIETASETDRALLRTVTGLSDATPLR
jgi:hypothetical protein